jgi:hypothetical protein
VLAQVVAGEGGSGAIVVAAGGEATMRWPTARRVWHEL